MRNSTCILCLVLCAGMSACLPAKFENLPPLEPLPADAGVDPSMDTGVPPGPPPPPENCPDEGLDPSQGQIHYVCDCGPDAVEGCVAGDDSGDGRSPQSAWQSYERARLAFPELNAGDSIAFCRGGHFQVGAGMQWSNAACTADRPCVIRDYNPPGAQGAPRPLITSDDSAFRFEDGGPANHEEGVLLMNLVLRGSDQGYGVFFYNDIDDVLMCNLFIESFQIGVHVGGSNEPDADSDGENARILLSHSEVRHNSAQGWLGGCDDCGVERTRFVNNGFAEATFNHNIYFTGASVGMRAVQNELYQSAVVDGACQGVSLVVHGSHDRLLIDGNIVREDIDAVGEGCWGISVDAAYGRPEGFTNVRIQNNTVINVGNTAIGVSACQDCIIEGNVIIQEQSLGANAIAAPVREDMPDDLPMERVTIRNNSIYAGPQSGIRAVKLGRRGSGHVMVSNAVHHAGVGSYTCFDLDLEPQAYDEVDHNLCFTQAQEPPTWNANVGTLDQWRAMSGFDTNSAIIEPGFADPESMDLRPSGADAPMVNAGHASMSSSRAHDGKERDEEPDIGAFEFVGPPE